MTTWYNAKGEPVTGYQVFNDPSGGGLYGSIQDANGATIGPAFADQNTALSWSAGANTVPTGTDTVGTGSSMSAPLAPIGVPATTSPPVAATATINPTSTSPSATTPGTIQPSSSTSGLTGQPTGMLSSVGGNFPSSWDATITSGTTTDGFTFLGINPDGTANWRRDDGQVFNNVSYKDALGFGANASQIGKFYQWDVVLAGQNGEASGFRFLGMNADGTANWQRDDGQVFNNISKDQALQLGATEQDLAPFYQNAPQAITSPLPGTWDVTISGPNGTNGFRFLGQNADGTANWQRNDGEVFNNVSYEQARSMGAPESVKGFYESSYSFNPAGQASAQNADTALINVTPDQTVAGQFDGLINSNNPLIQGARTRALQGMNQRGLLNSSMALGAADLAAYEAALPIAQADAATNANAATQNAAALNRGNQFNASLQATTSQFNAGAANAWQSQLLQTNTQLQAANLSSQTQIAVADLNNQYRRLLQGSESAAKLYSQMMTQLLSIYQDGTMDAAGKQAAIDAILSNTADGLLLIQSIDGVDLSGFLA